MRAWEEFLTQQEADFGKQTVTKWLRSLRISRFDACNLFLEAENAFQILWFEEHVRKKAQEKFLNHSGKHIKIHLSVTGERTPTSSRSHHKKKQEKQPSTPNFALQFDQLDPHAIFANLVICESNLLAYKLLCNATGYNPETDTLSSETPALSAYNPIYLYGSCGTGKTHFLMAAAHALVERGLNALYARAETFTEHVVSAIRTGEMSLFRQTYRNIDVLLMDDIQVFSRKGATQEEFFHTFNTLHLDAKQIILSANCPPAELHMIEPRLVSRFEWGIVIPLEVLPKEKIGEMLQKKAAIFNFPLSLKVSEYLQSTFTSSTKALSRALEALLLRSHLSQTSAPQKPPEMSVHLVQQFLADLIREEEEAAITPKQIIQLTAGFYGLASEDILGKSQTKECVCSRQIAMYLCRHLLHIPYIKIGDLFSKDHSTVMSSVKQIQKAIDANDQNIANAVKSLKKKIKP